MTYIVCGANLPDHKEEELRKPIFTMFDFVGVTDFHGDDEAPGEGGVVTEPPRKYKSEPRKLLSLDIDDLAAS